MVTVDGPIADYLAELARQLKCSRDARSDVVDEIEDHLRESAEHACASGLSAAAAERRAVADLGRPALVAGRRTGQSVAARLLLPIGLAVALVGLAGVLGGVQSLAPEQARPGLMSGRAEKWQPPDSSPGR